MKEAPNRYQWLIDLTRKTSAEYQAVRQELIETLRDCGVSEKEIFKQLDSSEYGRKTKR